MAGFGPGAGPFMGVSDPAPRLQYYSSQQTQAPAAAPKELVGGRRAGKVKFFDTQKVWYMYLSTYRFHSISVFTHLCLRHAGVWLHK